MKFVNLLVFFLFLILSSCHVKPNLTSSNLDLETYRHVQNATVALVFNPRDIFELPTISDGHTPQQAYCAGVFVARDTIISAAHCFTMGLLSQEERNSLFRKGVLNQNLPVIDGIIVKISTSEMANDRGNISDYRLAQVVFADHQKDLAVLRIVRGQRSFHHEFLNIHSGLDRPSAGERVYTIGHPSQILWNFSEGFIASFPLRQQGLNELNDMFILTSMSVFGGSSGGPLFDSSGNLLGICRSYMDGQFVFFTNYSTVIEVLEEYSNSLSN